MRSGPAWALLVVALLLACGSGISSAQTSMLAPTSTRSYAMGLSGVADDFDPGNLFYNPAVLGALHGLAFRADLQPDLFYSGDDNLGWSGLVAGGYQKQTGETGAIGFGVGFTYARQDWKEHYYRDDLTEIFSAIDAGFRYAFSANSSIGLGIGMNNWSGESEMVRYYSSSTFNASARVFDAGIIFSTAKRSASGKLFGLAAGVSYLNWGGDVESGVSAGDVPTEGRVGVSFRVVKSPRPHESTSKSNQIPLWRLIINTEYASRKESDDHGLHTGAEFSIREIGFIRAGHVMKPGTSADQVFTVGLGVGYDTGAFRFRIDYARAAAWKSDGGAYPLDHVGVYFGYSVDPVGKP